MNDLMAGKKNDEPLSDSEAERRATDALRRALTTPYTPQKEMKRPRKAKAKSKGTKATPKKR
jgi:hypothetical protein